MKLSTKGRYAVTATVDLARHSKGRPVALADIALRQGISLSYLEQLFARLRRGGIVKSARGPGGGYMLARGPDGTRIADIILAVDEPIRATLCEQGSSKGCSGTTARCITHDLWDELSRQIHVFLASVTVEDVLERRVIGTSQLANTAEAPEIMLQKSEHDLHAAE